MPSVNLFSVLGHIAALVNDINDMSYTNMPASLAKAYTANAAKPLQQKVMPTMKPSSSTPSASSGPWVGGYKAILTAGAQGAKPVYMPVSGYNLGGKYLLLAGHFIGHLLGTGCF